MARKFLKRDTSPILGAAEKWIKTCLIEDGSLFLVDSRWALALMDESYQLFVEHPDTSDDDFMTKLNRQMKDASTAAQQLMAEMLWALLLFPSNMKARTKRHQVREIWGLSGQPLPENHPLLADSMLNGIGSGGPGFNNYRPDELAFLICLVRDLKQRNESERQQVLTDYDSFFGWIESVPRKGSRQFRHMLRFFAFPELVERISSNNDRRQILKAFGSGSATEVRQWSDRQLDEQLLHLRNRLQTDQPLAVLDFYEPPLSERWSRERRIKTTCGEVTVTIPGDDEEAEGKEVGEIAPKPPEARASIQIQAKLVIIGAVMGFKVWIPRPDRIRVMELVPEKDRAAFVNELPLNYEKTTLDTIELIDVLWLKQRSIVRAFEVEHTTAVYSGLLRMADLLALQPNMNIQLHIVAPDERREKVFREMNRPVFSLLEGGSLADKCSFISYESVDIISALEHLAYTDHHIIAEYEERAE